MTPPSPAPRRSPLTLAAANAVVAALVGLFLLFMLLPTTSLVASGGAEGLRRLADDAELRSALWLTLTCATAATLIAVVGGTPLAYLLARKSFPGRSIVAALVDIPLVIPHPVAGIALLLALGRQSTGGSLLEALGTGITGSATGIIAAMTFVAAPLFVAAAREAIEQVDPRLEGVARTLGDSGYRAIRRVTLPLASRGLLAAGIVMWSRAASEFGAIVVLTYNPKVASVLSYDRFTTTGLDGALPVAAVLVIIALIPLAALRALRHDSRPGERE
ncbi:MAG TPA: ABC transporter permease [Gemmatimonadaceae bacterium]|nr:ABC transporter permease [Gemmatimonadaceae bacterium]